MELVISTWPLLIFDNVDVGMRNKFVRLLAITNIPVISDYDLTSSILNQKSKKHTFY